MKVVVLLSFLLLISCKQHSVENAVVVKDCTGSYLRISGKDFLICNDETVQNIADQTAVSAKYSKSECTTKGLCLMAHPTEGSVNIEKITAK